MHEFLNHIILGILQGITEFLPVSSSGHLVVAQKLLGVNEPGFFVEVCLHFGTLVAIIIVFRRQLLELTRDGLVGAWVAAHSLSLKKARDAAPAFPTAVAIVIGTVPAACAGVLLEDTIARIFEGNTVLTGMMLFLTGVVLLASRFARRDGSREVNGGRGFCVGIAQACALLPGISRSGMTIVAGYFLGLEKQTAAHFAFLLAVPIMLGAVGWDAIRIMMGSAPFQVEAAEIGPLMVGSFLAAIVGWICLKLLLKTVSKGKLYWFSAYCMPMGLILLFV
ncbi:MAG: undecaprenyl-diphosphate phosphatase [Planctomycetes bacterium]|nr:undecaprenyl-diphosphate phosphatase [Planctomycetota bacterium]